MYIMIQASDITITLNCTGKLNASDSVIASGLI